MHINLLVKADRVHGTKETFHQHSVNCCQFMSTDTDTTCYSLLKYIILFYLQNIYGYNENIGVFCSIAVSQL